MRILIVDDEPGVINAIKAILETKGHQIDVALDGAKGLRLIKAAIYDLVFLDVNMPDLTGLELIGHVKKRNAKTRVVIVSGYEVMEGFLAQATGADDYLQKPFKVSEIEAIVDQQKKQPERPPKILLVDDDGEITHLLTARFENAGFEILTARDSDTGLKILQDQRPDLMILDLWLKPLPGEEVCKWVREHEDEALAKTPIVMLSGKTSEVDRIVGKVLGANSYFTKPVDSRELLKEVQEILGNLGRQPEVR